MFTVALIVLVSICAVQSQGIYGDVNAVIPQERSYVQDLIDLPKPLDENSKIQRCGKQLSVTLNYLCPSLRRSSNPGLVGKIERKKRQLLTEECCDKACTLGTLLQYCPQ